MELEEDLPPQQEAEKRKKKRKDRRKTNSSESSPTNPFKVEPCEEQEEQEQEELAGSENVNQKPRVVVPSPPGILFLQMTFNFSLDNCQIFSSL